MNKKKKTLLFALIALCNTGFYYLCGYWQNISQSKSKLFDFLFGILAIVMLSLGVMSVIVQIYCRIKNKHLTKRELTFRFPLQCALLLIYYTISICLKLEMVFNFSIFYLAVFAVFLSFLWMRGSRVLWTGGEKSYYLDETGRLFTVNNINENDDAMELACSIEGDRDRNITIYKRKQYDASDKNDLYQ